MLSFMLFAGALHTNFNQLKVQCGPVLASSTIVALFSTLLVGVSMHYVFQFFNMDIIFIRCLLFGAR